MKSRGKAPLGLLVTGLAAGAMMVSAPEITGSDALNVSSAASGAAISNDDASLTAGGRGDYLQHLGCDRPKKPTCNKPGRRSTRR